MQTFLPSPNYAESARCLDRQRLGKQRVECLQILKALRFGTGWRNHPAVKMWRGFEHELIDYGLTVCSEWVSRGYVDNCAKQIAGFDLTYHNQRDGRTPSWLGDDRFHASHRAALLYKLPKWYRQFGWLDEPAIPNEKGSLPYVWPV